MHGLPPSHATGGVGLGRNPQQEHEEMGEAGQWGSAGAGEASAGKGRGRREVKGGLAGSGLGEGGGKPVSNAEGVLQGVEGVGSGVAMEGGAWMEAEEGIEGEGEAQAAGARVPRVAEGPPVVRGQAALQAVSDWVISAVRVGVCLGAHG